MRSQTRLKMTELTARRNGVIASMKVQIRDGDEVIYERPMDDWEGIEITEYGAEESFCRECGNNEFLHIKAECVENCLECAEPHRY